MSVLAADLEVRVAADIEEAIKKLSSIERYAQQTTNALNKPSKVSVDTADAEKKIHSLTQKIKDGFKASLAGLNEAGRGLLAGDSVGFFSGLVDTMTGLVGQIPLVGSAATVAGNGVKSLIMPMEKLISLGMQWDGMWERNKKLLISMGDSAESAEKQLNGLYQMAIKRGYQMDDLTLVYQRLRSIGFSADDATEKLKGFTNASAAIGGGAQAVETMAAAFEQMKDSETTASRVIKQFERMGLPIIRTLSEATGFSPKRIREMMKKEQIDSEGLMDILTREFQSGRFTNLAETMAKGLSGQQNAFQQISAKLAGEATSTIRSVMGARLRDVNEIIGSDSAEGLILGFKKGLDIPVNSADYLVSGFLQALKSYLGIQSPSTLMRDMIGVPMGLGIIAGLQLALQQEGDSVHQAITKIMTREGDTLRKIAERYNVPLEQITQRYPSVDPDAELDPQELGIPNGVDPKRNKRSRNSRSIEKIHQNYQNLLKREPQFESRLDQLAKYLGIDPSWLLNVMAVESAGSFDPHKGNGQGYYGLIQFGKKARETVGLPLNKLLSQSATEQLDYVQKYFEAFKAVGQMRSQADVYNVVAGGKNLMNGFPLDPNSIAYAANDPDPRIRSGYFGNKAWDINHDRIIQNWELGKVAMDRGGFSALGNTPITGSLQNGLTPAEQTELETLRQQLALLKDSVSKYNARLDGKTLIRVDAQTGEEIKPGEPDVFTTATIPSGLTGAERMNAIADYRLEQQMIDKLAQIIDRINELEAKQQAAQKPTVNPAKSTDEPGINLSNFNLEDYPDIKDTLGSLGSMITLAKESLPQILTLAGQLASHELPQLKDGWTAANNAAVTGIKRTTEEMERNRQEFQKTGQTLTSIKNAFESSFASAFSSWEGGFKGMLGRMVTSFAQALQAMIAQALAARLADLIFGNPTQKGGGNWFTKFLQWGISALGGSIGGTHSSGNGTWAGFGSALGSPGGHAAGGWMNPGEWSWVGENGPELMRAGPAGASIYSNHDSRRMMGGNTYNIHVNVPASRSGYIQPRERRALAEDIVGLLHGLHSAA